MRLLPIPQALLDPVLGAANAGAEGVATRLGVLAAAIPDRRLDQLMRTPLRRVFVETIFLLMPYYLDRSRATGMDMTIRWRVTGPDSGANEVDVYDLIIEQRRCRVIRGESPARPLVTITIGPTELLRLITGRSKPMQSYLAGRLSLRGDIMQAARLSSLFRIPAGGTG
jgi:hypothetical protein